MVVEITLNQNSYTIDSSKTTADVYAMNVFRILLVLMTFSSTHASTHPSHDHKVSVYAEGIQSPWGMKFLPDGRLLVTEKSGQLRLVSRTGAVSRPIPVDLPIAYKGQGGMLDVALDPAFADNQLIYLSYAKDEGRGQSRTAVAKGRLTDSGLNDLTTIWQQAHSEKGNHHFGSRLVFDRQGQLFVTTGDRNHQKESAQDVTTHFGKIIRINTQGQPSAGNPFIKDSYALPDIYSYGHRNVQGAYLHPDTGELWINEHGPRGGDEINRIEAGKNYGWPKITYGINYIGTKISDHTHLPGMEQPIHYWDPSIATSGMLIYSGDAFPEWKGHIFTGALKLMHLNRIALNENNKVTEEERLLLDQRSRIRAVEQGPDGHIYVATDGAQGKILKISPQSKGR